MFGAVSDGVEVVGSKIPSVQYANETPVPVVPSGWKYLKLFATAWPWRSG